VYVSTAALTSRQPGKETFKKGWYDRAAAWSRCSGICFYFLFQSGRQMVVRSLYDPPENLFETAQIQTERFRRAHGGGQVSGGRHVILFIVAAQIFLFIVTTKSSYCDCPDWTRRSRSTYSRHERGDVEHGLQSAFVSRT
jgi:hypothetical protein